ncbi:universal stress protein [Micrococcales bacterium 31B]|nr:universal stress protein [Micrococcales bacterium 31B]
MAFLVAFADSAEARSALAYGFAKIDRTGESMIVLDLTDSPAHPAADSLLTQAIESVTNPSDDYTVVRRSDSQDVASAVLDAAQETGARSIVIGMRRRSPVGKLFLGSNAQRILLDADVPVTVVKAVKAPSK